MSFRKILACVIVAVICLSAVVVSFAEDQVELNFLYIWPEHREAMEESIAIFERDNPNVKVNVTAISWDKLIETIQVGAQTGDMYDVTIAFQDRVSGYAALGVAMDLTPYLDADPEWRDSFISESALADYATDGHVYGLPFRGSGMFIFYNADLFAEKGYAVPQTEEELLALMDQMVAEGVQPFSMTGLPNGYECLTMFKRLSYYNMLEKGFVGDPMRRANRLLDYQGTIAAAAEKIRDFYQKGFLGDPLSIQREEAQVKFFQGNVGMLWCNNNELTDMEKLSAERGINIAIMEYPKPEAASELIVEASFNDGMIVWAGTPHPDEAVALAKSLTSMETQSLWANTTMSSMCIKGIEYADELQGSFADAFMVGEKYKLMPDWNTGTLNDDQGAALIDFLASDSMTGEEFEQQYVDLIARALEDAEEE